MNCFEETERVVSYIEEHLDSVKLEDIARLTGIPAGLFQRIFSYVCGVSIAEYIRKRRLMFAAERVLAGGESIVNIALDCGYASHAAFTRAIREHFDVPPTGLTEKIYQSSYYKRFSFHDDEESYQVMKGRKIMAQLVKIEYEEMSERLLIGVSRRTTGLPNHKVWDYFFENGINAKLDELAGALCPDVEECIGIGYASDFPDEHSLGDEYIVGKYYLAGTPVPAGLTSKVIPKGIIAKAQIKGKNFNEILNNAFVLINNAAQQNGYRLDFDAFYWSEVYTIERYCKPAESGGELILDWYMPCHKA